MKNVDVVMCTWNSNKPYFVKCLNSVKSEVPVHCLILIDRFSDDGTVEAVRKVFPNAVIKQTNERLGSARKRGIELVDTGFFVFVDSDIELCKGWFKYVKKYFDSSTGGVNGLMLPTFRPFEKWVTWSRGVGERFKMTLRKKVFVATSENPDIVRGGTHNTLIRTCLVKDWNPIKIISAFEDHLLLRHVVQKGYKWKIVSRFIAIDHGVFDFEGWIDKLRWNMAGARLIRHKNYSLWNLLKALPTAIIIASYASLRTKDPILLPYLTLARLALIQGWVAWSKYIEMER